MNAHAHPLIAGILNAHASAPMQAGSLAMAAEMQAIVDGIKAKRRATQAAAVAHYVPMAAEAIEAKRTRLHAELDAARSGFDPAYEFCDDYSEWARQSAKAATIARIERALQGAA